MSIDDIIRMARECGNWSGQTVEMNDVGLERFANLVAAAERNKVAQWMIARSYATGHGDTVEDLLKELAQSVREEERELCAQVCDAVQQQNEDDGAWLWEAKNCAIAIRARGEK
jgi:hypothetical protein